MEGKFDARLKELPSAAFHELVGRISAVDEFKGWWRGRAAGSPSVLDRLRKETIGFSESVTVRFSARPSFPLPQDLSWGRRRPATGEGGPSRRAGYRELLRSVFEGYREMEFGEDLILRFHGRLFHHSGADRTPRGQYKSLPDRASVYRYGGLESPALRATEPHLVPKEMEILTRWTSSRLRSSDFHPLLVIASFLLEFLAIRPFADGNGRMSRILATLLLLQSGYEYLPYLSLDKVITKRGMDYAFALRRGQAKRNFPRPDITPWLRGFLDTLQAHAAELRAILDGRPREDLLSGNQRAVLSLFDRHPEVSTRRVCGELGIPRDTAKQVLSRLSALGLVRRTGAGRATRYHRLPLSPG